MNRLITIIIPIYNDEKYIEQCISSIRQQTYSNFECLCLDDGSSDNTLSLLKEMAEKDNRIKIYENKHKGPGWQRNYGISIAKGDYITFMDHDDFVEPTWLEKLYSTIKINNVDVSYCANRDYFENNNSYNNYFFDESMSGVIRFERIKDIPDCLITKWFAPWRRLIKKDFLIKYNIKFAEGNYKFDDVLFTEELMLNIKSVAICNEVLYTHRIFDNSITGKSFVDKDIYFEHFNTIKELIAYANIYDIKYRDLIIKMFPFFKYYLFYVDSKMKFFNKLLILLIKVKFPIIYYIKMIYYFFKIFK